MLPSWRTSEGSLGLPFGVQTSKFGLVVGETMLGGEIVLGGSNEAFVKAAQPGASCSCCGSLELAGVQIV